METASMEIHDDVRHEIKSRALAHMVDVVTSTPVEQEPFPHFVAQGIFPNAIYQEMLALLPEQSLYDDFKPKRTPSKKLRRRLKMRRKGRQWSGGRGRFKLTNASIDRLRPRQRSLWLGVRDALGAPEFKAAVFNRLSEGLALRFGDAVDVTALPGYPLPELFRETSGYVIKPHPDTPTKVVTMQVALPPDDSQENLGTEFYRRSRKPLHWVRNPRGFAVAKRAPFLPNVAYAFVVINEEKLKSWHGRTKLKGEVGVRNSLLQLWYAKPHSANADIVAQYYQAA